LAEINFNVLRKIKLPHSYIGTKQTNAENFDPNYIAQLQRDSHLVML